MSSSLWRFLMPENGDSFNEPGCPGLRGQMDPTGATGLSGLSSFAYFSATGVQTIEPGDSVAFNQTPIPAVLPDGFSFIAPTQIIVNAAGLYEIKYYLMPRNANATLAVFIDGAEAPQSRYTSTNSAGHVYGELLVSVTLTPSVITLVNVDSKRSAVTDNGQLDGTISVSLMISKIR